jgi:hypothetical protein
MLNFLFKSAFYYTVFSKYKRQLSFILINILSIFFIQYIYPDVTTYLNSVYIENDLNKYLLYALLLKVGILLFNVGAIAYILYKIFSVDDKRLTGIEGQLQKKKNLVDKPIENIAMNYPDSIEQSELSIEEQIRQKKTLQSRAEKVINEIKS